KWVLGPYGRAFLYIAKRRQDGVPLEQTSYGRRAVSAERVPYFADTAYVTGARRFDMGERDHFISLEMAAIGMELMARWGSAAVVARLRMLTDRLAAGLADSGVTIAPARVRAPHVLSLSFSRGMPERLFERLAAENIYVASRLGRLRISPHVYNDEVDVDRFVAVFRNLMRLGAARPCRLSSSPPAAFHMHRPTRRRRNASSARRSASTSRRRGRRGRRCRHSPGARSIPTASTSPA